MSLSYQLVFVKFKNSMKKILVFILLTCVFININAQVRTSRFEVKIPSLWCEECELVIESGLLRYDGIMEIDAKWRAKKAVIRYIPDRIDTTNIKVAVAALGFDTDEDKANEKMRKLLPECCQKPPPPKGKAAQAATTTPTTPAANTTAAPATPAVVPASKDKDGATVKRPEQKGSAKPTVPAVEKPKTGGATPGKPAKPTAQAPVPTQAPKPATTATTTNKGATTTPATKPATPKGSTGAKKTN